MMDNYERNAHFQDSARQVSYKILDLGLAPLSAYSRDDQKLVAEIIAQYAYDLACYVANETTDAILATDLYSFRPSPEKIVHDIPDLTSWPKTASE